MYEQLVQMLRLRKFTTHCFDIVVPFSYDLAELLFDLGVSWDLPLEELNKEINTSRT